MIPSTEHWTTPPHDDILLLMKVILAFSLPSLFHFFNVSPYSHYPCDFEIQLLQDAFMTVVKYRAVQWHALGFEARSWVRIPFNPTSLVTGFIALFSLSILLFQYRSHKDTLANSSFEISSFGSAHVRINYTHECINYEKKHSQGKIKWSVRG